jgi:phage baseplate assembly protein W
VTFSLKVVDGDLALKGSQLDIVHGVDKLKQDISLWLRDPYQSDRFHTGYGSILDSFIGQVIDDRTQGMVQSEVMRVLQNFQALQLRRLSDDPQSMAADEVLVSISDIRTVIRYDTVIVTIRFVTGARKVGQISVGIQV